MKVRSLIFATALVAGLACTSASAVTWVAPHDYAPPLRGVSSAPLARHLPGAVVTLKLTVGPAAPAPHPRHLADRAGPPLASLGNDLAPVRHDSDTNELPAELAKR